MFGGSLARRPATLASAKIDGLVCVSETKRLPELSVLIDGQEKYSPEAPNMMSCTSEGWPSVATSTRCAHDLSVLSPGGVQTAEAALQRLLSRQIASSMRKSPEWMHGGGPKVSPKATQSPEPAVSETGGLCCSSVTRFVTVVSTTSPPAGVPVILMTVNWSWTLKFHVVRY